MSLADDITCISTKRRGLKRMIDNYRDCANKWMFQFNEVQSCVIQISKCSVKPDFDWKINHELSLVADSHIYLGIEHNGK